jgi:cytochrome c biogenesis protein
MAEGAPRPARGAQSKLSTESLDLNTGEDAGGPNGGAAGSSPGVAARIARWIWRQLTSLRLTLWLVGILASAMAAATLIPQNAPREAYLRTYGTLVGPLIAKTTLRHIYTSWWFIGTFALLAASLVACVIYRAGRLVQQERAWPGPVTEQSITSGTHSRWRLPQGAEEAQHGLAAVLRGAGYAVAAVPAAEDGRRALVGRRGRLTPWAPIVVHAGLVVILLGAAWGRWPSHTYRERPSLRRGEAFQVRTKSEGFGIRLLDAGTERDAMGRPTDYWARVQVLEEGDVVRSMTIRPNVPLRYHGISTTLYSVGEAGGEASHNWQQVGWVGEQPVQLNGLTFRLVHGPDGYGVEVSKGGAKTVAPIALGSDGTVDPMSSMTQVDDPGGVVFVHSFREQDEQGRPAPAAQVFFGTPGASAVVLDLDRDVGVPVVFTGFVIISLGALLVLGAPRSRVIALLTEGGKGSSALVRVSPAGDQGQAEKLWREFESRLGAERQPDRGKLRTTEARRGKSPSSA